jgi:putative RNA 2'-phosphotransferase
MIRRCSKHGFFREERCRCGEVGKLILDEKRTEHLGRFVAGALRHFPDDLGLEMSPSGWVDLALLADVISTRYRWANRMLLIALVESDPKRRYEIRGNEIRARYGHSVDVDLDHPENQLPKLYYGASEEEALRIIEVGLKTTSQRYVHLSTSPEKARFVGTFRTSNPIVIEVDAEDAQHSGVRMMTVNDDIVLSETIPPEYLRLFPTKGTGT